VPGEDDRSISKHVSIMKEEMKKKEPNVHVLKEAMKRSVAYHHEFCHQHTTEEVLNEFPVLTKRLFVSTLD